MEQSIDILGYLKAFRRRWWVVALPVVLLMPLVIGVAYVLPPIYTASARLLVVAQTIPAELARSTVAVSVGERIALIQQRLMTRENLLDLARRFDVTRGRPPMSPSEVVDLMRDSTQFTGLALGGGATGVNISFTSDRADLSAQLANEFMSLLLQQNIQQRTERATETSEYFRQETERLSAAIARIEERITEFKLANENALPDSLSFRRQELARLQQQVFERELRQIELREQRQALEEALNEGRFLVEGQETPAQQELARLRLALMQRSTVYAETHPSIRFLRSQIARLEEQIAPIVSDAQTENAAEAARTAEQRVNEAIEAINQQIERLEIRRTEEVERIEALEASIERTPAVELELGQLEREWAALNIQYSDAVLKRAQAETGERLEVNQQAERFEVIERAEVPTAPSSPNRPLIVAAGFVGSLGLGFALALLLELMNRTLRTPGDLERQLDMRPVVTIPYIRTQSEVLRRRWTIRVLVFAALVGAPLTVWAIDQFYQPLPLLFERLMRASGLDGFVALIDQRFD